MNTDRPGPGHGQPTDGLPDTSGLLASTTATEIPCAARPATGFIHRDGPCRCFVGGPQPEFAPAPRLWATAS